MVGKDVPMTYGIELKHDFLPESNAGSSSKIGVHSFLKSCLQMQTSLFWEFAVSINTTI